MADYTKLPSSAKVQPVPFTANIPDDKLKQMIDLVKLAPVGPQVFENTEPSGTFGMSRAWLIKAKDHWVNQFDWRAHEKRINSFPNFTTQVTDESGHKWNIHFIALFSNNENAIPIGFFHGWPGSILEFLDLLDLVKKKYTPDNLPYHIIVPSLPGYAFSSGPSVDKDTTIVDLSRVCQRLMHALGFEKGYIAQGGDLGSFISRRAAEEDEACKAFHLNFPTTEPPENKDQLEITPLELSAMARGKTWVDTGTAYGQMHGTRTATIGLALSSSPLALLSWIGEKFLEWSDEDPSVDQILESVSLYWLTDTFPRCIYPYRSIYGPNRRQIMEQGKSKQPNTKPMGYSWFPKELVPLPISWIATTGNLVHHGSHERGGHFAAMEKPQELLDDVEAFVKVAWKPPSKL